MAWQGNHRRERVMSELPTLLSVEQFVAKHAWATRGGIRQLLFNRHANGLDVAVVRLGRKLLLDEAAVFAWLDERGREGRGK